MRNVHCGPDAQPKDVTGRHRTVETEDGERLEEIERFLLECGSAFGKDHR